MMNLEAFEKQCEAQEKINQGYLDAFRNDLEAAGLSEKTIRSHLLSTAFYLNTYLVHDEIIPMEDGCKYDNLSDYFGWFFIRKCAWSTPATIKTTAASLKKFYKCMLGKGYITEDIFNEFADTIKYSMEDWQSDCASFNETGTFPWLDI